MERRVQTRINRCFAFGVACCRSQISVAFLAMLLISAAAGPCLAQSPKGMIASGVTTSTAKAAAVPVDALADSAIQTGKENEFNPLDIATFQNFDRSPCCVFPVPSRSSRVRSIHAHRPEY